MKLLCLAFLLFLAQGSVAQGTGKMTPFELTCTMQVSPLMKDQQFQFSSIFFFLVQIIYAYIFWISVIIFCIITLHSTIVLLLSV